jgi:hypothetical protein
VSKRGILKSDTSKATIKALIMKRIILSFVAIFIAILTFGQINPQASGEINQKKGDESIQANSREFPPLASIVSLREPYVNKAAYKYEDDNSIYSCRASRKMEIAGIVLSSIGGGFIIGGSVLKASANRGSYDGTISNYNYYRLSNGGGTLIGLGVIGVGAGIPLAVIGSINVRRYCYGRGYRNESEEY